MVYLASVVLSWLDLTCLWQTSSEQAWLKLRIPGGVEVDAGLSGTDLVGG
jgi:hypothetical protein